MAAPFSKIDFILILNFMENELKSKDEIIELLKKHKQYSQSSETKYGKIGPGRSLPKPGFRCEKKTQNEEEEGGEEYGIDPLAKLSKLIDSHRMITDGLQTRLANVSELYGRVSESLTNENLKRSLYESGSQFDNLVYDVHSLNRQLEDLKQESRSAATRLLEVREAERTARSSRRGTGVLAKLVSNRPKLASELADKCREVGSLERDLEVARSRSKQLEEKLLRLEGGACEPANQRKRARVDELNKELNRLLLKVKVVDDQSARLTSTVADMRNRQHHPPPPHHHQIKHLLQEEPLLLPHSEIRLPSCRTPSSRPLSCRPPSAVGNPYESNILGTRSPLPQQTHHAPYLSSTVLQILQPREGDELPAKNPQQTTGHPGPLRPQFPVGAPSPIREVGRSPCHSDSRVNLGIGSPNVPVRGSPARESSSRTININFVAGGRLTSKESFSEGPHFSTTVGDDDHLSRQRHPQQVRLLPSNPVPARWSTPTGINSDQTVPPDARPTPTHIQKHQQLPKSTRFPTRANPALSPNSMTSRAQKAPPPFKPGATTADTSTLSSSSLS